MSLRTIGARARAAPTRAPRLPEVDGGIVLALFAVFALLIIALFGAPRAA